MSEEITQVNPPIEATATPVVATPTATTTRPARKVIIAFDESQIGYKVLDWINNHGVLLPTDEVTLVLVINEEGARLEVLGGTEAPVRSSFETREFRECARSLEGQAKQRLSTPVKSIQYFGIKNVKIEILKGSPGEAILKYAKLQQPDIVMCGNRGLGFLKRKLMGSTSEYLSRHLQCTLMVVRLDIEQQVANQDNSVKKQASPQMSPTILA